VSAEPVDQLFDYATWGYWNLALEELGDGMTYHLHEPNGLWVAGVGTDRSVIDDLFAMPGIMVGQYEGPAYGSYQVNSTTAMVPLTNGSTNLNFYFSSPTGSGISGNISFTEGVINLPGSNVNFSNPLSTAFSANDYTDGTIRINGSFFGGAADTMAGRFYSNKYSTGEYFSGIFGGNLTAPPAQIASPPWLLAAP